MKGAIQDRFGTTDRLELRKIVFADPEARQALEAIVVPETIRRIHEMIFKAKTEVVIAEITVMGDERRLPYWAGTIAVLAGGPSVQLQRLTKRDGVTFDLACQMIQAQPGDLEFANAATQLIHNNSDELSFFTQLDVLKAVL
jgi:dephospho-CoA kinase